MKLKLEKKEPRITTGFSMKPSTITLIKKAAKAQGVSASHLVEALCEQTLPDFVK